MSSDGRRRTGFSGFGNANKITKMSNSVKKISAIDALAAKVAELTERLAAVSELPSLVARKTARSEKRNLDAIAQGLSEPERAFRALACRADADAGRVARFLLSAGPQSHTFAAVAKGGKVRVGQVEKLAVYLAKRFALRDAVGYTLAVDTEGEKVSLVSRVPIAAPSKAKGGARKASKAIVAPAPAPAPAPANAPETDSEAAA